MRKAKEVSLVHLKTSLVQCFHVYVGRDMLLTIVPYRFTKTRRHTLPHIQTMSCQLTITSPPEEIIIRGEYNEGSTHSLCLLSWLNTIMFHVVFGSARPGYHTVMQPTFIIQSFSTDVVKDENSYSYLASPIVLILLNSQAKKVNFLWYIQF